MYASCGPDETLVSGGFSTQQAEVYSFRLYPNQWYVAARLQPGESVASYATCLHAELSLSQEPPPPQSQPPGGPPLQPPPGFGK